MKNSVSTLILLLTIGSATGRAEELVRLHPCGFVVSAVGGVWSPDCRAYFLNHRVTRISSTITGPLAPFTVRVVWFNATNIPKAIDPTAEVQKDFARGMPRLQICISSRIEAVAVKWVNSEQLLLDAYASCDSAREHRTYTVDARSGRLVRTVESSSQKPR